MEVTMTTATVIDAHPTKDLFLKVSSFTRYLLDDVLPAELYKKQSLQSDLEEIAGECEELVASLRKFKQFTKLLQVTDTVSSMSQTNEQHHNSFKIDEEHALKFSVLCEDIRSKVISLPDMMKFKPYYCKICNLTTCYESDFNRHCTTKKHIAQANQISGPLAIHKCKTCHLLLLAPKSEINQITSLFAHNLLDEYINKLQGSNDKTSTENLTNSTLYKDSSNNDVHEISDNPIKEGISDNHSLPYKVKQLFKVIKNGFKGSAHLIEDVPHYCNVCDIMVYSVSKFIDHTSSKEHIAAVNSSTKLIDVFKCEICGFLITGFDTVIDETKNSNDHRKFDEFITCLKASKEHGKITEESNPKESSGENVDVNTNFPKESIENTLALNMLKKSISSLIEILRLPTDLKKHVSSCCFVCKKIFSSNNDFKQHILSRKHISLASSFTSSLFVHYCPFCSLSIYGTDTDIRNALETEEHLNLHKRINYLFHSNNETADPQVNNLTLARNSVPPISDKTNNSCSNDLKKSIFLKDIKQTSEKYTNFEKGNQSKLNALNHHVPDKFLTINCKLQCGDFSKSGFCRPCKKAVNLVKGWTSHLSCSKHKREMGKHEFENIPLPCEHCSLQILGDQIYGNPCMDVHIKLNHPNEKKTDKQWGLLFSGSEDEITENYSRTSSNQSKSSETIGSNNYLDLSAENRPRQFTNDCTDDLKPRSLNHNTVEHNNSFSSKELSNSTENKGDCLKIFIDFLNKRKATYINEGLKQFGGMCLFCVQTYDDFFEWLLHLKDPCHKLIKKIDSIEKECKVCNLNLFGSRTIVENEFWYLSEHVSLDALVTQ